MATPNDRQERDEKEAQSSSRPHLGDSAFANQNIFNTERGQTDDLRRRDVLDETGEVTTAAVPDRTPRAPAGREDPADRQNVGSYDERREDLDADEKARSARERRPTGEPRDG